MSFAGFEGVSTVTFGDEIGGFHVAPAAECDMPEDEPFDRLLHEIGGDTLGLAGISRAFNYEDQPPIVHPKQHISMALHGAGHISKLIK